MLSVHSVSFEVDRAAILEEISFSMPPGEKVGLVGANGSGKSTLLKLIAGEIAPTRGSIQLIGGGAAGYLPQIPPIDGDATVFETLAAGARAWSDARTALDRMLTQLSSETNPSDLTLHTYSEALEAFEAAGGWDVETRIQAVREGLGLGAIPEHQPFAQLSGGQKTRVMLGTLLIAEPSLLLLDEPTNYLDLPALLWLEDFIQRSRLSILVVSHDRRFLDATVSRILEIDPRTHTLRSFPGNYSFYAAERVRERRQHEMAFQDQQEAIAKTIADIRRLDQQARGIEQETINFHYRKVAKGIARRAKVQERRLERGLARETRLDRPESEKPIYLNGIVAAAIDDRRTLISTEDLAVAPDAVAILKHVDLIVRGGDRIAFVGENGSGKTSLLRTLLGELEPASGTVYRSPATQIGYLNQELLQSGFDPDTTVFDAVRTVDARGESELRNLLAQFHFTGDEVFRFVRNLSAGERIRLELALMSAAGANLLVLDEPTSHLDLPAIEQLELALRDYRGAIVAVSHDRAFLHRIGFDAVYEVAEGRLHSSSALLEV